MTADVIPKDSGNSLENFELFDLHESFSYYNDLCFDGFLEPVRVTWSKRLTLSAGQCEFKTEGYCEIKISESILKYRTAKECKEILLHEMIHAYLFLRDRETHVSHGKEFIWHMSRVNEITGLNVKVFHEFHAEVDYLRKHIWRCDGPCRFLPPYFGYVKRARNLAPGPRDIWWEEHRTKCFGKFVKISGESNISTKERVKRDRKHHQDTIDKFLKASSSSRSKNKSPLQRSVKIRKCQSDTDGSSGFPIVIPDTQP